MMSDEDSMLYTGYPLNWSYNISQWNLLSPSSPTTWDTENFMVFAVRNSLGNSHFKKILYIIFILIICGLKIK